MTYRPRRSALFMPASNVRALEKAKTLGADTIIFDLEDSVGPDDKEAALDNARRAAGSGEYGLRELVVRVNSHHSEQGHKDILAVAGSGAHAVLAPKVNDEADIFDLCQILDNAGAPETMKLWVMMETPRAIVNAAQIARVSQTERSRLSCFIPGTNDLAKETGAAMTADRWNMINWLSTCVVAAKAYGLTVLDSVYNDFSNMDGFRKECEQGRALGMDGKTLIHPAQIDTANDVFGPSEEEVVWSRKILEAFNLPENEGKGVISLEGRMVERLHAEMAAKTVEIADIIEALKSPLR